MIFMCNSVEQFKNKFKIKLNLFKRKENGYKQIDDGQLTKKNVSTLRVYKF